jgi:hypothetical protein
MTLFKILEEYVKHIVRNSTILSASFVFFIVLFVNLSSGYPLWDTTNLIIWISLTILAGATGALTGLFFKKVIFPQLEKK